MGSSKLTLSQFLSVKQRVDIHRHLARCEANFSRLVKLLTDSKWEGMQSRRIHFKNGAPAIQFKLRPVSQYTQELLIQQKEDGPEYAVLNIQVKLYLDVRSAEVTPIQSYRYLEVEGVKKGTMTHRFEKMEMNRFLTELLDYCLRQGQSGRLEVLSAEEQSST